MHAAKQKATGAHFTPPQLARVVAIRIREMMFTLEGSIRILDPACGDGNLLSAMAEVLPAAQCRRVTLVGIENDDDSFDQLSRNRQFRGFRTEFFKGDFLDFFDDGGLFGSHNTLPPVDVVVANPPYVRTQVLGATRSQKLAARFGLSGRVDLYQAFLVAMARQLRPGGILGVITSNRFMTTRGGTATRAFLRTNFDLVEIVDLGDTKLFEAAVLPALIFGIKRRYKHDARSQPRFVRIYEDSGKSDRSPTLVPSVLTCLEERVSGVFRSNGTAYQVNSGRLAIPSDDSRPWTLLTNEEAEWIESIDASTKCRLGDVAKVRVGIKTTADGVYVRRDWNELPKGIRPEPVHLLPILSQENAAKWQPQFPSDSQRAVLYTHEVVDGTRRAIRFNESSPSWKYLLANRERLESRQYVTGAGRAWYEIWVPQDPSAWNRPKIVFPDISPEPRFFLDTTGRIVDGNCYWITTNDRLDEELLMLVLGTANSSLMKRYHDLAFQNRLYSQRRRHLTQYVTEYPLPDRNTSAAKDIIAIVRRLSTQVIASEEQASLEMTLDATMERAFGM